jgi:hypothetical protein
VYTTGEGIQGFLRLYPTLKHQTAVPSAIPDAETLYISWNISERGVADYTLTAPDLYKLSATSLNAPLSFTVVGADGPDTCREGYVWREAFAGDRVCVLPETRTQAAIDNERAGCRVNPHGAFGSKSCIAGYVWREARHGDDVCVSEATRQQVVADDALPRVAASNGPRLTPDGSVRLGNGLLSTERTGGMGCALHARTSEHSLARVQGWNRFTQLWPFMEFTSGKFSVPPILGFTGDGRH